MSRPTICTTYIILIGVRVALTQSHSTHLTYLDYVLAYHLGATVTVETGPLLHVAGQAL